MNNDKDILDIYRDGNRDGALELLIQRYQKRMYWHIRKIVVSHDDADDALQNTFIKVWQGLDKFRGDSALGTWMYRIATNEGLEILRQRARARSVSVDTHCEALASGLKTDPYFSGDALQLKLQEAILRLPEKQRIVFNLRYYDGMTYEEMSQVLDTSVGALKASYHLAAKKIEATISETVI